MNKEAWNSPLCMQKIGRRRKNAHQISGWIGSHRQGPHVFPIKAKTFSRYRAGRSVKGAGSRLLFKEDIMEERRVSRREVLKLAGAAGAVGVAGMPIVAVAAETSDEKRLFIGFSLHPTGPTSTAGTFVMSGRFEDSGASTASDIALVPIGNTDRSRLSGNQQFVGQKGTIFTHFEGISFPNANPHVVGEGQFMILSGTDAYAGARGRGSFVVFVDFLSSQLIGTETGNVES